MNFEIISLSNPKAPEAEAYRTLRTNLQYASIDNKLKSMVITSSTPAEGKSTTITNLAVSFAQTGIRVLVIEGDLRRPRIHRYFNVANTKGITNYLAHNEPLESVIKSSYLDIDVLTCGPIPPNPAELLNSNKLKQLMETLRDQYDMILVDAPPVGMVTDAAILSKLVDGTLMVVASGQTDIELARRSMKLLQNVDANILGSVVTMVPVDKKGYYGYQYYEYMEDEMPQKSKRRRSKQR